MGCGNFDNYTPRTNAINGDFKVPFVWIIGKGERFADGTIYRGTGESTPDKNLKENFSYKPNNQFGSKLCCGQR